MSTFKNPSLFALSLTVLISSATLIGCGVRNQAQFRNKIQTVNGVETVIPGDSATPSTLQMPTDKFGPMDPSLPKQEAVPEAPAAQSASVIEPKTCTVKTCAFETVTIDAAPEDRLKISPTDSNEKLIVSLSAILKVQKSQPQVEGSTLNLISAKDVKIVNFDLGQCQLLAKNFVTSDDPKTIKFTLLGMDDKSGMNADGCLVKLSELSMTGFTAEFQHVRVGGVLSETYVPTVRVNVAPHASETSR